MLYEILWINTMWLFVQNFKEFIKKKIKYPWTIEISVSIWFNYTKLNNGQTEQSVYTTKLFIRDSM